MLEEAVLAAGKVFFLSFLPCNLNSHPLIGSEVSDVQCIMLVNVVAIDAGFLPDIAFSYTVI